MHGHGGREMSRLPRGGGQSAKRSARHAGGKAASLSATVQNTLHSVRVIIVQVGRSRWSLALCLVLGSKQLCGCAKIFRSITGGQLGQPSLQTTHSLQLGVVRSDRPSVPSVVGGSLRRACDGAFVGHFGAFVSWSQASNLCWMCLARIFALRFVARCWVSSGWLHTSPKAQCFRYVCPRTGFPCLGRHDVASQPRLA